MPFPSLSLSYPPPDCAREIEKGKRKRKSRSKMRNGMVLQTQKRGSKCNVGVRCMSIMGRGSRLGYGEWVSYKKITPLHHIVIASVDLNLIIIQTARNGKSQLSFVTIQSTSHPLFVKISLTHHARDQRARHRPVAQS